MEILSELLPILVTGLVALVSWAIVRLESVVKASKTDIDDKVFNAVKKAFVDLAQEEQANKAAEKPEVK
jgi:hypothetical protein